MKQKSSHDLGPQPEASGKIVIGFGIELFLIQVGKGVVKINPQFGDDFFDVGLDKSIGVCVLWRGCVVN